MKATLKTLAACAALAAAGADCILFETFADIRELEQAVMQVLRADWD